MKVDKLSPAEVADLEFGIKRAGDRLFLEPVKTLGEILMNCGLELKRKRKNILMP